jgi:hypothetical protein
MTKIRAKKADDWSKLNGKYPLKDNDYIRVQWYPGIESFYGIINDDPGQQLSLEISQLVDFLQTYSKGFVLPDGLVVPEEVAA